MSSLRGSALVTIGYTKLVVVRQRGGDICCMTKSGIRRWSVGGEQKLSRLLSVYFKRNAELLPDVRK